MTLKTPQHHPKPAKPQPGQTFVSGMKPPVPRQNKSFNRPKQSTVDPHGKPVGRVVAILANGSVAVQFSHHMKKSHGQQFELYKNINGVMTAAGVGTLTASAGRSILTPGPNGFSPAPSIGDTVGNPGG
jgi:hypothetical protein